MTDKDGFLLMSEIADRALRLQPVGLGKKLDVMMDLEYTNDDIPLDLEKFLAFDDGDFGHDISGIVANFNRETLKMDNFFVPRCALREDPDGGWSTASAVHSPAKVEEISKAVANENLIDTLKEIDNWHHNESGFGPEVDHEGR